MSREVRKWEARPYGKHVYAGFPCTIVRDRYNGGYSGGKWLAFPCESDDVPAQVNSGDCESMEFWDFGKAQPLVGRGMTLDEAYDNLLERVAKYDWSKED